MEIRFLYHALATGVSGDITAPFHEVIEVQGASALPLTGGHSSSRTEGFRYRDIVSFASASTVAAGNESGHSFNTLATATVERLNIFNVLTADRVVARLASKYSKDKDNGDRSYTFAGSYFENLRIAGHPVEVDIDPERLKSARRSQRAQFGTFAAPVEIEDYWGLELLDDGAIHVPEFGRVYLAESLVTPYYQTIAMIRVVLGCAHRGGLTVSNVSTNGEPMPG